MKQWIKIKDEDHPWLRDSRIGVVACIEEGKRDRWYSAIGKEWDGGMSVPIEEWFSYGFEVCTESEAKELLMTFRKKVLDNF